MGIGLVFGLIAVSGAGCAASPRPTAVSAAPTIRHMLVQPGDFANAVADPGRVTINVHVPFEGSIPGTELSIPYNRIAQQAHVNVTLVHPSRSTAGPAP